MNPTSSLFRLVADAVPQVAAARGHEITWPWWSALLLGALLAVLLPFWWNGRKGTLRQPPRL